MRNLVDLAVANELISDLCGNFEKRAEQIPPLLLTCYGISNRQNKFFQTLFRGGTGHSPKPHLSLLSRPAFVLPCYVRARPIFVRPAEKFGRKNDRGRPNRRFQI